jgi:hypothetical protein
MKNNDQLPFILRYEEEPEGDSVISDADYDLVFEPNTGGMEVRAPFVPWDIYYKGKM